MEGDDALGTLYPRQASARSVTRNPATVFALMGVGCICEYTRTICKTRYTEMPTLVEGDVYKLAQYYVRSELILLPGGVATE